MKMSKFALTAMVASACFAGTAFGQSNRTAPRYYPASYYSYYQDGVQAPVASASDAKAAACCDKKSACDVADICNGKGGKGGSCDSMGSCGCGNSACDGGCGGGCGSGGCGSGCGGGLLGLGLLGGGGKLGDPWKLAPNGIAGVTVGGWSTLGYHTAKENFNFNNYDSKVQLQQQWLYAEKTADGSNGIGFGGRLDYLYGTDGPDTQSFGIPNRHWDNSWDNGGAYGHAMPQAYGEAAVGDLSVKVGHFFTIVGNEVVQATGNFFYSRQFTFYNAIPFTHTGALSTYKLDADTQLYNGYVMGWDSGYENNGNAYIGGFKRTINDKSSLIYTTVIGEFGKTVGEKGSINDIVYTNNVTEKLTFISQTSVLQTSNSASTSQRNTFGNINYLIYKMSDRVALGQRFEWFNYGGAAFNGRHNDDLMNHTVGINYKVNSNVMLRPEVRWIWDRQRFGFLENNNSSQAIFGMDSVMTF